MFCCTSSVMTMQEVSQSTSVKRSGDYVRRGKKKKAAQLPLCFSTGWENPQLNQKHRTCNHQGREKIARNASRGNWFLLQSSIFLPSLPSSSKYIYILYIFIFQFTAACKISQQSWLPRPGLYCPIWIEDTSKKSQFTEGKERINLKSNPSS